MLAAALVLALVAASARADWASGSEELSGAGLTTQVSRCRGCRRAAAAAAVPPTACPPSAPLPPDAAPALQPQPARSSPQGVKIVLNPSKPKLTVLSTTTACGDGSTTSADCAGQFLMTAIKDLYEVDAAGAKVSNRGAGDVLDLSQVRPGGPGGSTVRAVRHGRMHG